MTKRFLLALVPAMLLASCEDPAASVAEQTTFVDTKAQATGSSVRLDVTPGSFAVTIDSGSAAPEANASVSLSGRQASKQSWSATARKSWTVFVAGAGKGNGTVRWNRNMASLPAGLYIDTITVTAGTAAGSPARVIDSVRVIAAVVVPPPPPPPPPPTGARPDLGVNANLNGRLVLPAGDPWNTPVDGAEVDPNSLAILTNIGLSKNLHPDFGANWNGGPFGIPYIIVPDDQARVPVSFLYADESDVGPYPIPANPPIEPGSDRHLLMITRDEFRLFELFDLQGGPPWSAGSGAIFDLVNGTTRPAGWTSADAAGLPIFPGLVRYDEVVEQGAINHALRFTVTLSRRAYLAPARHWASSSTDPLRAPMGMRVRLKASYNISGFPAQAQVVLRALQRYGMMVADNGGDFFLSGTADSRWNDTVISTLKQVKVSDFEVIQMTGIVTP